MKFDSNLAWKEASAAISANREVLLALTGVFLILPSIAFALLFPQPEPPAGMEPTQAIAMMRAFYVTAMPFLIPMALIQAVGGLAMLTLFTDRSRPTVADAIRQGAIGVLPYLGAQLLAGMAVGLIVGIVLALVALTGVTALVVLAALLLAVGTAYIAVKISLVAPVIAVEHVRNPVAALRRSWLLTRGNSVRIFVFFLLILVAFGLTFIIVMALVGVLLALVAGAETGKIVAGVVSSVLSGLLTLYLVGIVAAIHRQLAGTSTETLGDTFS